MCLFLHLYNANYHVRVPPLLNFTDKKVHPVQSLGSVNSWYPCFFVCLFVCLLLFFWGEGVGGGGKRRS